MSSVVRVIIAIQTTTIIVKISSFGHIMLSYSHKTANILSKSVCCEKPGLWQLSNLNPCQWAEQCPVITSPGGPKVPHPPHPPTADNLSSLYKTHSQFLNQIHKCATVPQLNHTSFMNICSKLDWLHLNDVVYRSRCNSIGLSEESPMDYPHSFH